MTSQQADLFHRLQAFRFDPANATFTFEDQLMQENGWSRRFARRTVEEYRRFLLLAATCEHTVSPSDAVDQVWHLHLLYTRGYWDELCGRVLPRALHHEPGTSGDDRSRFDDVYTRTLHAYRQTFGDDPPRDIWPEPAQRRRHRERFRRVDLARSWVIPRPPRWQRALIILLLLALVMLASGCSPARPGSGNPLDLPGPLFLLFYVAAFTIAALVAAIIRMSARGERAVFGTQAPLHALEAAYLSGGPDRCVGAAIAGLAQRQLLRINPTDGTFRSAGAAAPDLHPLEKRLHERISPTLGTHFRQVRSLVQRELSDIADDLVDRGLVIADAHANAAVILGTLLALAVPAIGVMKICIGLSRGRPVGYLAIACIVSVAVALLCFARRPHRTRRGDDVLARLQARHARLRDGAALPATSAPGAETMAALAVGLFGLAPLAGVEFEALRRSLRRGEQRASSGGFDFIPTCGTGGDGGSGCGGGGCGGCGGCGG